MWCFGISQTWSYGVAARATGCSISIHMGAGLSPGPGPRDSTKRWPKSLGSCTQVEDLEEAPGS